MKDFSGQKWWAYVRENSRSRSYVTVGPFETREKAAEEGWKVAHPKARHVSTGYGAEGAYFDIRWHPNRDDFIKVSKA